MDIIPTFANPWVLPLLLLVPPLAVWWLRQQRAAIRYPETALLIGLPSGRGWLVRWGGAIVRASALGCLIIALAGPRWPDLRTRVPTEGIAIAMVVDVSGSMNERDFIWQDEPITRLDAVKKVFRLFVSGGEGPGGQTLEGRPNDLIGLVAYDERPEVVCPLTLNHSVLLGVLDGLQPRAEATNIGDAVAWGMERLRQASPHRKVLLLLTDGYHTVTNPRAWKPRQAANVAAALPDPIIIYPIDAGRESKSVGESAADRAAAIVALQDVANLTGGKYFQADNSQALLDACAEIDRLERSEVQSFQYRRYFEGYPWFGLASFVLWMGIGLLEISLWRRVP